MSEEPAKVDLASPDLAAEKRAAFENLFPGVLADGVLDATRLGEALDTPVAQAADARERFGLMWAGKQEAVRSLLEPSRGALVPDLERSIDFDTAQNVFIEGDNLEVLKLMQKAYNDKVKLIYIDPPYNTGNDFVYNDDFADGLRKYLEYSGQLDADGRLASTFVDLAGRRHSRWLSMIYPRIALARNLLTQDGVLLCSINDKELPNLLNLLREVFGEENYLATFVWNNDGNIEQQSSIKVNHEYIVAFARDANRVAKATVIDPNITEDSKLYNEQIENSITKNGPKNPESTVLLPKGFPAAAESFRLDPRDDAYPLVLDPLVVKKGEVAAPVRLRSGWSSRRLLDLYIENGFVPIADQEGKESWFAVTATGAIYGYKKRSQAQGHVLTVLRNMGTTKASSSQLEKKWGVIFDFPKPERLIQHLVAVFSGPGDLVVDFFAGSGTTAHAVGLQNVVDNGGRRCISVNFPERVKPDSAAARAGFATVSEITLRRIEGAMTDTAGLTEQGLRILRLSASEFRVPTTEDGGDLFDISVTTLVDPNPSLDAVASEVLLKEGVTLDSPWRREALGDALVVVSDGVAIVLSLDISDSVVEDALALEPRVLLFLEDGFAGKDAIKANAFTRARNAGITMKTV